ncbi:uncharacterized protein YndB with AHSA1/START domain [Sinomonas atrocyanea]|uniref:SRPBCC family protein n=1 Tax=Sinomonas atrocyanea TaxID=37927 RepID=UPI0027863491|nr:SRPBCC family protein [Sinomonas atrocyanea]MDQ0258754.1 uncharacterized protein YndB with AHSA1/START domain [Sinomonas atrocyanea]
MEAMVENLVKTMEINAPVDTVFTFLSDPTRWMLAFPGDSEVTDVLITPDGVGTSAKWAAKIFGVHMSVTHEYREVVHNQRIVSKATAGPVLTFSLAPQGAGTVLSVEQGLDIETPLVRVPLQALFTRWAEDDIEGLVANIKSLVETGQKTVLEPEKRLAHTLTWSGAVSIHAPVERVFDLVKDPAVWLGPDVRISDLRVAPEGVGTTFEASWRVLGIPLRTTHEYTEFVPHDHFTSKAALGPVFVVAVAPEDGGTRLSMRSDVVPANWADAAVDSLVIKMSEGSQEELLAGIKAKAEAGAGL